MAKKKIKSGAPGGDAAREAWNEHAAAAEKKVPRAKPTAAELARSTDIERVRVEKDFPVAMNHEESERASLRQAKVQLEIRQHETELAAYRSGKLAKLRELKKEAGELAQRVDSNTRLEMVSCWEERIFRQNLVRYVDSAGTVISERPMKPGEFDQRTLDAALADAERVDVDEDDAEDSPAAGPVH